MPTIWKRIKYTIYTDSIQWIESIQWVHMPLIKKEKSKQDQSKFQQREVTGLMRLQNNKNQRERDTERE